MKTLTKISMAFSFVLMFGGIAFAYQYDCSGGSGNGTCVATKWIETFDYSSRQPDPLTINFDLTSLKSNAYNPSKDTINSAYLDFGVNGKLFRTGSFDLTIGNGSTKLYTFNTYDVVDNVYLTGSLLYDLQQDGKIAVVFDSLQNATLDCITLTASGYDNCPTAVPEPSTMFLFGAGLIGVGILRRRASK